MHLHFTAAFATDHRAALHRAAEAARLVDQAKRAKSAPAISDDDGNRAMRWLAGNLRSSLALCRLRARGLSRVADVSVTCDDQHLSTQRRNDSAQRGRTTSVSTPANELQTRV